MIPADKIKWIIENIEPKGFKWYSDKKYGDYGLETSLGSIYYLFESEGGYDIEENLFESVYYPLFLQRVIEGLGCNTDYIVIQGDSFINVTHKDSEFITDEVFGEDESSIDECKEKAILYIVDKIREK